MSDALIDAVNARWNSRTKPPGSLGLLENLARDYCLIRGDSLPECERLGLYLFAADHGIADEGVSAYPKAVTREMVKNFERGGAAVNALARGHNVLVKVIDAGVGTGTRSFLREAAMSEAELRSAIAAGREWAREASGAHDLVGLGEMGIGNTTTAAALLAAYENKTGAEVAGAGTGLDGAGIARKAAVIDEAMRLHDLQGKSPMEVLRCLGGLEIAQMTGFLLEAPRLRLPVMLDGFITCAAALAAIRIDATSRETMLFSHRSAERGHGLMLEALDARPPLDLEMRLGEGTGAILGMGLVRSAVRVYREMASFADAGVSGPA
jgi:nicotinate-nucleotide--dimethylbenzimidazole phosphoribosyltransferase